MKVIYKVTVWNNPELTYHFSKRDDMEEFLDFVPEAPEGGRGYSLGVIPVYVTGDFSFAIKDLTKDLETFFGKPVEISRS